MLAGGPIAWHSRLQPSVTLSSSEAEYMALTEAGTEAKFLASLLNDVGFPLPSALNIKEDNTGAISFTQAHYTSSRAKHIDVRHHWIRQELANGVISVSYIPTCEQLTDILTKNLPLTTFRSFVSRILRVP